MFFSGTESEGIGVFSLTHILILLTILVLPISLMYLKRVSIKDTKIEEFIRYFIIVSSLVFEISLIAWYINTGYDSIFQLVPIEFCGLVIWTQAIALYTQEYQWFKVTYFLLLGATLSLAGLTVNYGVDRFRFWVYMLSHSAHFWGFAYVYIFKDIKPNFSDLLRSMKIILSLGIFMLIFNIIVDWNYFYMVTPAIDGTPLTYFHETHVLLYSFVWIICVAVLMNILYLLPFTDKSKGYYKK